MMKLDKAFEQQTGFNSFFKVRQWPKGINYDKLYHKQGRIHDSTSRVRVGRGIDAV